MIYLYDGVNVDSGLSPRLPKFKILETLPVNKTDLYNVINLQRTVKDKTEIDIMKFINEISSDAHKQVMK